MRLFTITGIYFLLVSCNIITSSTPAAEGVTAMSEDSLAANMKVLSSDEFLGRKPFTPGETKTLEYLQSLYQRVGLEPGNGNSYLQEVPLVNIKAMAASAMQVQGSTTNLQLNTPDDYVIWTDKTDPVITLNSNEVVFAGFGIVAPEYGWNDYAGLDVKDKVVLVMVNDPGFWSNDTSLFKGKAMTFYGRWTYKFEEAARQGAKACLVIHNTAAASYPFAVPQNNFNSSRLRADHRNNNIRYCDAVGWISEPATLKLFKAAGLDSNLLKQAATKGFKSRSLNLRASTSLQVQSTFTKSYNVIGKITGNKRPSEVIVYTAHWDHLGVGKPDETGDSIYNGALDNASGTAGLIELARAFKTMKDGPGRTIVFLAVTAEEQGLLGSAYYAQNPVYPVANTVANINMDGLNFYGKTKDIIVIGRGQSELEDYLGEEAAKLGRVLGYETHPEAGSYYRSDHFNFAKVGVPALYAKRGVEIIGAPAGEAEKLEDEYRSKHYHRPSDQWNDNWKLDGAIDDLKLLFLVGRRLANEDHFVQWKPGSEFRNLRSK